MTITPAAPAARALIAFVVSAQLPRWTSTNLSLTSAGKSLMKQPLNDVLLAVGCVSVMPLAATTCAVMSAVLLHVICAKSLVAAVPLRNVVPACGVMGTGDDTTSNVEGVRSDHAFGADPFAYGSSVGL